MKKDPATTITQLAALRAAEQHGSAKETPNMLIGRFYFKITPSGNLIGEYSHRNPLSLGSFAEAATRLTPGTSWVGDYRTTWCEGGSFDVESAWLKIAQMASGVFTVQWCDSLQPNAKVLFDGEAMLCDGMLVGDYHD